MKSEWGWALLLLVAGCSEATSVLQTAGDTGGDSPRDAQTESGDAGRPDVAVGSDEPVGVVMKVWQLARPYLLADTDETPVPFGPSRPAAWGGSGTLSYVSDLGSGIVVALVPTAGATVELIWIELGAEEPVKLATLTAPARTPVLVGPASDGRTLAYFDDGHIWAVRVGASPEDLGPWPDDRVPTRLTSTADGRFVVAVGDGASRVYSRDGSPRSLPPGRFMGIVGEAALLRVDGRAVRIDLAQTGVRVALTPEAETVSSFVGATANQIVFSFDNRAAGSFARRLGAVPRAGGEITWLSEAGLEARDGRLIGADVVYFEGTRGQVWWLRRSPLDGGPTVTVSEPMRGISTALLLGHDADRFYACDGRSALLSVPRDGRDAPWSGYAMVLDGACRWWGQTEAHVVLRQTRSPLFWRIPKAGGEPMALGDEAVVTVRPQGIVTMPNRFESQLIRQPLAGPAQALSTPYDGLLAGPNDDGSGLSVAFTPNRDQIVGRTDSGRWWVYQTDRQDEPRWLSMPATDGRIVAVDPPWVVVHRREPPLLDVIVLHMDGRFDAEVAPRRLIGANQVRYDRRRRRIVALIDGRVVVTPLSGGPETELAQGVVDIVVPSAQSAIFAVQADRILIADDAGVRPWTSIDHLLGQVTLTGDEAWMLLHELNPSVGGVHPVASWTVPTSATDPGPVVPVRMDGLFCPFRFGEVLRLPPSGRFAATCWQDSVIWESLDGRTPPSTVLDGDFENPIWPLDAIYGPQDRWFAMALDDRLVTYQSGREARVVSLDRPPVQMLAVGDHGVLVKEDVQAIEPSGLGLFGFRPEDPALVALGRIGRRQPGLLGQPQVVPLPDASGVLFASDVGGDLSLYRVSFDGRVRPVTEVDDAEEIWIGFTSAD